MSERYLMPSVHSLFIDTSDIYLLIILSLFLFFISVQHIYHKWPKSYCVFHIARANTLYTYSDFIMRVYIDKCPSGQFKFWGKGGTKGGKKEYMAVKIAKFDYSV